MVLDPISLFGLVAIVGVVLALVYRGWRKTAAYLLPGLVALVLGLGLTAAMRGGVIFIGAMVVGAFWLLRGFYLLFMDA